MSDAYILLNVNQGILKDFYLQAERVADHQTERVINQRVRQLKEIEERMYVDKGINVPTFSIDEVMLKVMKMAEKGDKSGDNWSMRELRIVSYYLMKLRNNSRDYYFALDLLDDNWRDLYFNGTVFYLMNSWNNIEKEYREATCKLVTKKLRTYDGKNRRYLLFKDHVDLFSEQGPLRMAMLVIAKGMDIKDAPKLIGFKPSAIKESYYSDVIVKYVEKQRIQDFDVIEEILKIQSLDRTKKLVLASLVEQVDNSGDGVRRSLLCKLIGRVLGDVTLATTWAPYAGATYEEAQRLRKAMVLVNQWYTQQIIEVFFEVCVQDRDRKRFWLSYVPYVSGFKIVGSTAIKRLLQSNGKLGTMFYRHFIETNSYTSQTSALVLFMKGKMIVEFSDTGALYVYNRTHSLAKKVMGHRYIDSTNDLKTPSINMLIESSLYGGYSLYEEGRMTHQGYWQNRLSAWMSKMVVHREYNGPTSIEKDDESFFDAQPLKKETKITKKLVEEEKKIDELNKRTAQVLPKPQQQKNLFGVVERQNEEKYSHSKNVSVKMSSKWVGYKTQYRVVCNNEGFYVNFKKNNSFVKIESLKKGESAVGNIWIKRPRTNGWQEIVHNTKMENLTLGFIKEQSGSVLFRENMGRSQTVILS